MLSFAEFMTIASKIPDSSIPTLPRRYVRLHLAPPPSRPFLHEFQAIKQEVRFPDASIVPIRVEVGR
jgi:hypothetical protein